MMTRPVVRGDRVIYRPLPEYCDEGWSPDDNTGTVEGFETHAGEPHAVVRFDDGRATAVHVDDLYPERTA